MVKFKLKCQEPSEREIQNSILSYLSRVRDFFAFEITTSARYDPKIGVYRRLGRYVLPGTPDIFGCLKINCPGFVIGIMIGLEVKKPKGVQSSDQKIFEQRLKLHGGHYFIVKSIDDVEVALASVRSAYAR